MKNSQYKYKFSILRFLIWFVGLTASFYTYVALTTPGGKVYSSFLHTYFDIVTWATSFIAKAAGFLLTMLGYNISQKYSSQIYIGNSKGVAIAFACLGFGVISFWVSFIAAHAASLNFKIKWITAGIISIIIINIIRVALIALANYYNWVFILNLNPHTAFNIVTYCFIFFLMFIFSKQFNVYDKKLQAS